MSKPNIATGQWLMGRRRKNLEYWIENYDGHTVLVRRNGMIFGDITAVNNGEYALSLIALSEGVPSIREWERRADDNDHYLGTFGSKSLKQAFRRMVFMDTVSEHQIWKRLSIRDRYLARQHELWRHKTLGVKMWEGLPYHARLNPPGKTIGDTQ